MAYVRWLRRWGWLLLAVVIALGLGASLAFAETPLPNPLAGGSTFSKDIGYLNITANGPAATIHGDPIAGRAIFASNCAACHGPAGIGGIPNPGSDDGTVPPLNPADPGFAGSTPGDAATFARNIDLFVQHGSKPSGPNPQISMPGWGDTKALTQPQIADVEAFIMMLNGSYWPDRWAPPAEVQMTANHSGDLVTYSINVVNDGASDMREVTLRDTLPSGLLYAASGLPALGQNPGKWNGTTVEWDTTVPQGSVRGPFVIVARLQGSQVPANVAQISFAWTDLGGNTQNSTAISGPVVPASAAAAAPTKRPAPTAALTATVAPTAQPSPTATLTPTAVSPTLPAGTAALTTTTTPQAASTPTAAPVQAPTQAATAAPTATPAAAASAGDATAGAQLFQSKGCVACHAVNGTGGKVGPDLTHIATTAYDSMANDPAFLARWLKNPPAVKPGTTMPNLGLSDTEIANLVAYLETLR